MPSLDWYDCPIVIPYYGGKNSLSKELIHWIPPHERYFEMFAGGLSMYFRKKKAKWNVVNDIDDNIVNLYMCVLHEYKELTKNLFWIPKSRKIFLDYRDELKDKKKFTIPDPIQASKYFYVIRYSFNKLLHTPFAMSKDMNKNWESELKYSRKFLGGTTIEHLDFMDLVDKYGPRKGDFWYLDPPYFVATERGDYYANNFSSEDHLRFKEAVDKINDGGAKFMISYDYRDEVFEIYDKYNIKTIHMKYSGATDAARSKRRKECVIMNYEPTLQEKLNL